MLGKLAKYLRVLGLDTLYVRSSADLPSYRLYGETSYFFTKRSSRRLSRENSVYIKANKATDQLKEVTSLILPYASEKTLMSRCIRCNSTLVDVNKAEIEGLVPDFVFHKYDAFKTCTFCKKIYWKGSHVEHMIDWIRAWKDQTEGQSEE